MRRLLLLALIALGLAPGTWLRSAIADEPPIAISLAAIAGPGETSSPAWQRAGVWHYRASHKWFGGFSALIAQGGEEGARLIAFTDRGIRFTLAEPSLSAPEPASIRAARQLERTVRYEALWDIESAALDPASGRYWLGYEYQHTIQRFAPSGAPDGFRDLESEVEWGSNSGAEAMVRLADGRFVVLPEGEDHGLVYPRDPVSSAAPRRFAFKAPRDGYAAVDAAQLPDGRLLILMRALRWGVPSFASLIAIGPPPPANGAQAFAPEITLDLAGAVPFENYEGLAVRALEDGRVAVWLIADDNFSILQRTLLARLILDPAREPKGSAGRANQKARE